MYDVLKSGVQKWRRRPKRHFISRFVLALVPFEVFGFSGERSVTFVWLHTNKFGYLWLHHNKFRYLLRSCVGFACCGWFLSRTNLCYENWSFAAFSFSEVNSKGIALMNLCWKIISLKTSWLTKEMKQRSIQFVLVVNDEKLQFIKLEL